MSDGGTVLVTGARSGFGRELVGELADRRPVVVIHDRATVRLVEDADLDGVAGQFLDGLHPARALDQAYDLRFRERLREATDRLLAGARGESLA